MLKRELYYHYLRESKLEIPPELAFMLVCGRVNPALPPRARTIAHARSKIWTAVVLVAAAEEATRAQLARIYVDAGDSIIADLREVAPRAAAAAEEYTIGSWRRRHKDCGGHGALFLNALKRALLREHPDVDFVQMVGMSYPRTVDAIETAAYAVAHREMPPRAIPRTRDKIYEAIKEEWLVEDTSVPDEKAAPTPDDENAPCCL